MGHAYADPNVGLHSALLALSALEQRRLTGEGSYIDVSMWEAMVAALATPLLDCELNDRVAGPLGGGEVPGAPPASSPAPATTTGSCSRSTTTRTGPASSRRWGARTGRSTSASPAPRAASPRAMS